MKTFFFLLFIVSCWAAGAQCTIPVVTASGPTAFCPGGSVTLSTPIVGINWVQKAIFSGTARRRATGFSIGSKGYIGTGFNGNNVNKDFWEYDPATDSWAQRADFGGTAREEATGFSIGNKGYIGTGYDLNSGLKKDFWEYDPATNSWVRKADFGGGGRENATGFSIGSKGYIGTGFGETFQSTKDFWEYNPATDSWISRADFGGGVREYATGFSIGSKGYIGTGESGNGSYTKDFWEYDPAANSWMRKADFGGSERENATSFSIGNIGYIGTGVGVGYLKDFYAYDPATNSWTRNVDFGGGLREDAIGFSIGSKCYIGTGYDGSYKKDFWEYEPTYTYMWNPGGQTTPSITVSATGNYTVTTTSATGCNATSAAISVTVYSTPTPIVTASGATALCQGSSVTLASTTASSYQWYLNGNLISGAIAQSYSTSAAGFYTVTTTNARGCLATSVATSVIAVPAPIPNALIASGPTTFCAGGSVTLSSPVVSNVWAQKADFGGGARYGATGFSIGSKGYIGLGYNSGTYYKDFWEYNPATNAWTQKSNFGGMARVLATGFSIGSKGYIGTGANSNGSNTRDFWEYDPAANSWTRKVDFGGSGRDKATGFSIGSKGYIGTGNDGFDEKDFWEYDPAADRWTQKADFGGGVRQYATGLSIGSKGYISLGYYSGTHYKDFWEYDPATDIWTPRVDFGGMARYGATGFSIGSKGYIGTGLNENVGYYKDLWEYDPTTYTWVQKADFRGTARYLATSFSVGDKGYVATGFRYANDFWEYAPGYTYAWNPGGQTTPSITTSASGNYSLTITNAFGCSATSASTAVKVLPAGTVYIDGSRATTGDGSSWATAYTSLREALLAASQCSNITTIRVAKGTYKPTSDANRDSAFTLLRGGLKIYGGYNAATGVRNIAANPTILSGDIGTANTASDNSYHVMVIAGLTSAADSVVLDGFTITGGNANGNGNSKLYNGAPVLNNEGAGMYLHSNNGAGGKIAIRNCIFTGNASANFGGGFYNQLSSPTISNCAITNNTAHDGAGMFNYNAAAPVITNCVFTGNTALGNGGGMYNLSNTPSALLVNCTFQGNTAATAGAVCNDMSTPTIINSIIWGNSTAFNSQPIPVTYSLVQGGYTGTGNLNTNPLFVNAADADGADNIFETADDGLQIQMGSPAGNAGNNAAIPAGITTDITGAARIQSFIVDMGAYENGAIILPLTLVQFSGKEVNGSDAQLQWKTTNEVNVSHFKLQRSEDGRSFSTIAQVQAKGSSTATTDYGYADKNLQPGLYYYRLRMVDKDGKETYSGVIIIILSKASILRLYPVPAKDFVWLGSGALNAVGKQAILMDVQGRVLQRIRINQWPQRIDISSLAPGTYSIKVDGEKAILFIKQE